MIPATMKHIIVASENPVKLNAARQGFARMFPDETLAIAGISVPSGVPHQPMTDDETLQGALTRATNARAAQPDAHFWIGIEGGCHERDNQLEAFAWIVVLSEKFTGQARTATFQLPPAVAKLVHQGIELGHADDQVFGRSNSKQSNGAVGLLTHDLIDRAQYYEHAVVLALIPFVNSELYRPA
jgi:inosine/xanthosine triphosphatase